MKTKSELCMECMECCRWLKIPIGSGIFHDDAKDFCDVRGLRVVLKDGVNFIIIPHVCPHLTDNGCDIYDERPKVCREYDGRDDFAVECLWGKDEKPT